MNSKRKFDMEVDNLLKLLEDIHSAVEVDKKKIRKKQSGGNVDKFDEYKVSLIGHMQEVRELVASSKDKKLGLDPREIITLNSNIREHMRQIQEDVDQLDAVHKKELKKTRSRKSKEELQLRSQMVDNMKKEVLELKNLTLAGYVKNYDVHKRALVSMEQSEVFSGKLGSVPVQQSAMSEDEKLQVKMIQQRDQEMDNKYLDEIAKKVGDLQQIALAANEKVKQTEVMIANLEEDMEKVIDKLERLNMRLKHTVDEVGRSSDKMCIDIVCIIIMLGMVGVLYRLIKQSK